MARSGILYGDSGTGKSTAAKHFSHYIYEKTHKLTLLLSLDGGGWGPMQPEINAGLINAYRCNIEVPLPTLRKISQGFWPVDSAMTRAAETNLVGVDWGKYGGVIVEGVTSISQALMRHLADKGIKTGEDVTSPFMQQVIVDGRMVAEQFAGNSRAHYGFVQSHKRPPAALGWPCVSMLPCACLLYVPKKPTATSVWAWAVNTASQSTKNTNKMFLCRICICRNLSKS